MSDDAARRCDPLRGCCIYGSSVGSRSADPTRRNRSVRGAGIDLDATYTFEAGPVAGLVSAWAAYPEFRSNLNIMLLPDRWWVGLTYRYLDEMDVFDAIGFDTVHTIADAQHYLDVQGSYDIGPWSFQAGVENLTNEEPPYVPDTPANTSRDLRLSRPRVLCARERELPLAPGAGGALLAPPAPLISSRGV